MKTKKASVKASSSWWCDTCEDKKEMQHAEMIAHLTSSHGLETTGLKCQKSMRMHLDGSDFFSSTWDVTIITPDAKEIKMTNLTHSPRKKNDPMSFGGYGT